MWSIIGIAGQVVLDVVISVYIITWMTEAREERRTRAARDGCHALIASAMLELQRALTGLSGAPYTQIRIRTGKLEVSVLAAPPHELRAAIVDRPLSSPFNYRRLRRAQEQLSAAIAASASYVGPSLMERCLALRVEIDTLMEYYESVPGAEDSLDDRLADELRQHIIEANVGLEALVSELLAQPGVESDALAVGENSDSSV